MQDGNDRDARFAEAAEAMRLSMYRAARGMVRTDADAEDAVSTAVVTAYAHLDSLRNPTALPGYLIAYIHAGSASPIPIEKQKDGVEASLHADGTLDFLVLGSLYTPFEQELAEMLQNGLLPIQFSIQLNSHEQADDESGPIWETDISMPYRPFQWWSSAAPRIAISQCGVLLDGIAFHGFLLSSKLDILYIVYDQEVFRQMNDSLRFEALDDQGQPMDSSFYTGYEKVFHDLRKTSYWQTLSLPGLEASPEKITLRAYNSFTNETYETIELTLQTHEIPEALISLTQGDTTKKIEMNASAK